MVRFLLHNSNATYDPVKKTWFFHLDQRISNPTSIALNKAVYTPQSYLTILPHVVYMHSRALSAMISNKHTVILRGDSHEDSSDVIAVLEETHTRGRYGLKEKDITFRVNPHAVKRSIDIYFTDGTGRVLDGEIQAGGGSPSSAADDATIVAIGSNILMWIDFSAFSNLLDSTYTPITATGDELFYIQNKQPGSSDLFFISGATGGTSKLELASFGTNTFGMTQSTGSSWIQCADTAALNPVTSMPFCLFMLFRTPPTATMVHLFKNEAFELTILATNQLQYRTFENGIYNNRTVTVTNFLPNQYFYLQIVVDDTDGDNLPNYYWDIKNLTTDTWYQENNTPGLGNNVLNWNGWYFSAANSHFPHVQSPAIFLDGNDATEIDACQTWMLAKWSEESSSEPDEPPVVTEDAKFFTELNIRVS